MPQLYDKPPKPPKPAKPKKPKPTVLPATDTSVGGNSNTLTTKELRNQKKVSGKEDGIIGPRPRPTSRRPRRLAALLSPVKKTSAGKVVAKGSASEGFKEGMQNAPKYNKSGNHHAGVREGGRPGGQGRAQGHPEGRPGALTTPAAANPWLTTGGGTGSFDNRTAGSIDRLRDKDGGKTSFGLPKYGSRDDAVKDSGSTVQSFGSDKYRPGGGYRDVSSGYKAPPSFFDTGGGGGGGGAAGSNPIAGGTASFAGESMEEVLHGGKKKGRVKRRGSRSRDGGQGREQGRQQGGGQQAVVRRSPSRASAAEPRASAWRPGSTPTCPRTSAGSSPRTAHGAGNAYNSGDTMAQVARNEYLNTLGLEDRNRAMAQMGALDRRHAHGSPEDLQEDHPRFTHGGRHLPVRHGVRLREPSCVGAVPD